MGLFLLPGSRTPINQIDLVVAGIVKVLTVFDNVRNPRTRNILMKTRRSLKNPRLRNKVVQAMTPMILYRMNPVHTGGESGV